MAQRRKTTPSAVVKVPDVLGAGGREKAQDDTVAALLAQYQREKTQILAIRQINKHKTDDVMPGTVPPKTYAERIAELGHLEQNVVDAFPEAVARVVALVESAAAQG